MEGYKVLVVEDDPTHQLLIRRALSAEASRFALVKVVESADDAHHLVAQLEFDAILTDNRILGARGLDLIAQLRQAGLKAPCVLMTASGSEDLVVRAHRSAVADYVVKDGDFWRDIPSLLERVIEVHRAEAACAERHAKLERTNAKLDILNTDVQLENEQLRHANEGLRDENQALMSRLEALKAAALELIDATNQKGTKLTKEAKVARDALGALSATEADEAAPPNRKATKPKARTKKKGSTAEVSQQATG